MKYSEIVAKIDTFGLIKECLAANKVNRQAIDPRHADSMDPVHYAYEFKQVMFNIGRQTGQTHAAIKFLNTEPNVLMFAHNEDARRRVIRDVGGGIGMDGKVLNVGNDLKDRYMRMYMGHRNPPKFSLVIVDPATFISREQLDAIVTLWGPNTNQILMLG